MKTKDEKRSILTDALVDLWVQRVFEPDVCSLVRDWLEYGRVGFKDYDLDGLIDLCSDYHLYSALDEAEVYLWQVVEQVGYGSEHVVSEWPTYAQALHDMCEQYTERERDELHVDILRNGSTEY
jgi:hypothetical protein